MNSATSADFPSQSEEIHQSSAIAVRPIRDLLRFTRTHLRHHEALMQATGGHFNLFQILGIGHFEVKTHSPILSELLNPQGRHGQGDVFLRLFLERLGIADPPFQASRTTVEPERYIGSKTDTEGGQIDIVIEDGVRRRILIENKIYAGDQDSQLLRYHNYDKKAVLIYLTLDGKEASEYSAKGLEPSDYKRISYEKEIRDWLMDCRKEAACLPGVREMLSQYIALIEELTHQSISKEMNKELIDEILMTPETLKAFHVLRDAEWSIRAELIARLDADLEAYARSLGLVKDGPFRDLHDKDGEFCFKSDFLNRNNLKIGFSFERRGYTNFAYGFAVIDHRLPCLLKEKIQAAFSEVFPREAETDSWPAWCYFENPYRDWRHEAFEDILSGKLAANIGAKLEKLSAIALSLS